MKDRIFRSQIRKCLFLAGLLLLAFDLQAQVNSYTPENIGLEFGMSEQALLAALKELGIDVEKGGKFKPAKRSSEFSPVIDDAIIIDESAGSVDVWSSGTVLLGLRQGRLTVIGEINELRKRDALEAFEFITEEFNGRFEQARGRPMKARDVTGDLEIFQYALVNLLFFSVETPDPAQDSWFHDNKITWLSMRSVLKSTVRGFVPNQRKRTISVMTFDACAYPELDQLFRFSDLTCPGSAPENPESPEIPEIPEIPENPEN